MIKINSELEKIYIEKLTDQLINGLKTQSTHKTRKRTDRFNSLNELVYYEVEETEKVISNELPCPETVIKLIADSLSVEAAIAHLTKLGYIVINPELANETSENKGLSESTIELIKAKILGISLN